MISDGRLVGNGDDEGARPVQPRVFQDLGVRGVAEQRVHAGRLQAIRDAGIGLDDQPRYLEPAEHVGDVPADASRSRR